MSDYTERRKKRYAEDPDYREAVLAAERARYAARKGEITARRRTRYAATKGEINARRRHRYATDPEYR